MLEVRMCYVHPDEPIKAGCLICHSVLCNFCVDNNNICNGRKLSSQYLTTPYLHITMFVELKTCSLLKFSAFSVSCSWIPSKCYIV